MSKLSLTNIRLRGKFLLFMLPILMLSVGSIVYLSYSDSKKALENNIIAGIQNTAELKVVRIEQLFRQTLEQLSFVTNNNRVKDFVTASTVVGDASSITPILMQYLDNSNVDGIAITRFDSIVASAGTSIDNLTQMQWTSYEEHYAFSEAFKKESSTKILVKSNIYGASGEVAAQAVLCMDLSAVYKIIRDARGLGETGEALLSKKTDKGALFLNPLRHDTKAALTRIAQYGNEASKPVLESSQGRSGEGIFRDYRGEEVIAVWRHIPMLDWGLVAKIDTSEAFEPVNNLRRRLVMMSIIIIIAGSVLAVRFAVVLLKPIAALKKAMTIIGKGDILEKKIQIRYHDEIGEMIAQANNLADFQKGIVEFTRAIGDGNFNYTSQQDLTQGELGRELQKMKENLQSVGEKESQQNWITEGLARFAEILRQDNDNLQALCTNTISSLVKYLGINQGAIYVIEKDEMVLKAAYAYEQNQERSRSFAKGEGLIGQAWHEGSRLYLAEIPEQYTHISSGLGRAKPRALVISPLMLHDEVYGAIELASFDAFPDYKMELIDKLSASIATTINGVKVNERTIELLAESEMMSEAMQAQEEELRQNAEEMMATQEEIQRAKKELEIEKSSLRAIIDNSDQTIFAINTQYVITVVNKKLRDKYLKLGIKLEPGTNILELIPEAKRDFWKERYDRALAGEKFHTVDEVAPGVLADVFHYPTYDTTEEVSGVAVVSMERIAS